MGVHSVATGSLAYKREPLGGQTPAAHVATRSRGGDRFIPRSIGAAFKLDPAGKPENAETACAAAYRRTLLNVLAPGAYGSLFVYSERSLQSRIRLPLTVIEQMQQPDAPPAMQRTAPFPTAPVIILDAMGVKDDFYSRVMDLFDHTLAMQLRNDIYFCNNVMLPITQFLPASTTEQRTTLAWLSRHQLMYGANENSSFTAVVKLFDIVSSSTETIAALPLFSTIACIKPKDANTYLVGGSTGRLATCDRRSSTPTYNERVTERGNPICSIASRHDHYFATGANDNKVSIWDDRRMAMPLHTYTHHAAVKGLAFNPVKPNLLASGGGLKDMTIKFFDMSTHEIKQSISTNAQNCGLVWDLEGKTLFANQGFPLNAINTYQFNGDQYGLQDHRPDSHITHILYCANSRPVEDLYITAAPAPDECVKIWNVKETQAAHSSKRRKVTDECSIGSLKVHTIR